MFCSLCSGVNCLPFLGNIGQYMQKQGVQTSLANTAHQLPDELQVILDGAIDGLQILLKK
eukprot:8445482-Lingulodinium_polyedra.AAC.1